MSKICSLCNSKNASEGTIEKHPHLFSCEVCEADVCDDCSVYRFGGYLVCKNCYDAEVGEVLCNMCSSPLTREEIDEDTGNCSKCSK